MMGSGCNHDWVLVGIPTCWDWPIYIGIFACKRCSAVRQEQTDVHGKAWLKASDVGDIVELGR